ncbi:MAG: phosphopantothenoylcysteine decarboxylase [Opitutaceae bacterium]
MSASKILFELSGSIAAWKACAVISRLVQDGHEVQTVATPAALRFVGAATLEGLTGRPVRSDLWEAGAAMEHINLVKWADLVVLCPATANTINRLAAGTGDDLLSTLFLAHDWKKPFLLAPAMNPAMWAHPATRASVERLRGWGIEVLPVARGRMACGDEGEGRLIEADDVLAAIRARLTPQPDTPVALRGSAGTRCAPPTAAAAVPAQPRIRILVTSGGTEEPIDGVRSIGNFSTGRTGALIAARLAASGYEVTLLRARRAEPAPDGVAAVDYGSFAELEHALRSTLGGAHFDVVIHAAAVGDYSVASITADGDSVAPSAGKIDSGRDLVIRLRPNPKLVDQLREWSANPDMRLVAFKLTRGLDAPSARAAVDALFAHARADFVVHNDPSERGSAPDAFPATIHPAAGEPVRVRTRIQLADTLSRLLAVARNPCPPHSTSSGPAGQGHGEVARATSRPSPTAIS